MGTGEPQDRGGQEILKQSYQQAYSWQQEGKTEQALSRYREILSQDPYNPYVLTNLGLIYQQTGNLKEAISWYEKALESDPKFVEAAQNLGVAWLKAGNSEEATRWLERALSLQPDNASALVNLGILYKRQGNREMARQAFKKAWTLSNRLPEASYNLARLEEEAGNIPEAYKYYQQFLQTRNDPNDTPGPGSPAPCSELEGSRTDPEVMGFQIRSHSDFGSSSSPKSGTIRDKSGFDGVLRRFWSSLLG